MVTLAIPVRHPPCQKAIVNQINPILETFASIKYLTTQQAPFSNKKASGISCFILKHPHQGYLLKTLLPVIPDVYKDHIKMMSELEKVPVTNA